MTPRVILLLCFSLPALLAGCRSWHAPALPSRNTITLDQLVVHSDTPLPQHHRLLQELAGQRMLLATKLGVPTSDEPINVYLFPTADRFKTFMQSHYPELPDRRAFFVETDTRLAVYAHWSDRVAEDLRHEVAHGYLHGVVPRLPLWVDEGLAEYFEVPRGHRGLHAAHVQELKEALTQGWRPGLARLEKIESAAAMNHLDYAEAWAWMHFLLETTPERQRFLQAYLGLLRQTESAEPLSHQLRRLHLDYERQLLDHVVYLTRSLR